MTAPFRYIDPDGDALVVRASGGGSALLGVRDASDGQCACVELVASRLDGFVTALYEAAGLPVPELVVPAGVDNAGQSRTTSDDDWKPYTDPREAAQAAAWAGEFGG